jgi:glycine C-acetyltransferase
MPLNNFIKTLNENLTELDNSGTSKGDEQVITKVIRPSGEKGPRLILKECGNQEFLRMNANSYLGLSLLDDVIAAEEEASKSYGVGPGAVRFISGTYEPHIKLEKKLADFHGRGDCMITSAAYTSVLGVIVSLVTPETIIISDELNHNCIINAMKLARPKAKKIFPHLDMKAFEEQILESAGKCKNLLIVTDGVFSMRGDIAPLKQISDICKKHNDKFSDDIILMVDDSHGVGAFGKTGRGTEEYCNSGKVDILVATLGKAFGVNGGYIVSDSTVIKYLREKNPLYIYTNPITPSEAAAALRSVEIVDEPKGQKLLSHLREMTDRFEKGLLNLDYETIPSEHPVVPLLVRDTAKTADMVKFLHTNGILATGLNYPVVPKGDQLIRFQISADHTPYDIDFTLDILEKYKNK